MTPNIWQPLADAPRRPAAPVAAAARLALLLGLLGGVVLTAAAGARRTDTAYPRLLGSASASQVNIVPQGTGLTGYFPRARQAAAGRPLATGQLYQAVLPTARHADNNR